MSAPPLVADLDVLVARACALEDGRGRALLGLTGPPGVGKSTLTDRLLPRLRAELGEEAVAHLPMDGFHLADVQLDRLGRRDRKGAPDTFDAAGYVATLRRCLAEPGPVYVPGFERDLEQPLAAALVVEPAVRLVVTEGNYLLLDVDGWQDVRPQLGECWYLDADPVVRRRRLLRRHEQHGKSPSEAVAWVDRSDEANARLVESTRDRADLVVPVDALTAGSVAGGAEAQRREESS